MVQIQILHASDLEGGVDAIQNAPNFAAIVDRLEEDFANTIILSAGDNYIPGPFFFAASDQAAFRDSGVFNDTYNTLFGLPADVDVDGDLDSYESLREGGGRVDISIMNVIGFDASAIGNHEFDLGTDAIADIIEPDFRGEELDDDRWVGSQFPYLSANLDFSNDGSLSGLFTSNILDSAAFETGPQESLAAADDVPKIAPATIINENGEQIGVVGVTTPLVRSISSPGDTTVIGPTTNDMPALAAVLQPTIDQILAQGVNKVVLVTHLQQIALEEELIGLLSGVDVVIAGGSDTLLADSEDVARGLQPGDTADRSYPIVTQNADGDPAVIVSTAGEYSYVGRLVLEFDDATGIIDTSSIDPNVSGSFATTDEVVTALYSDPAAAFIEGSKGAEVQELVDAVSGVVQAQDGNIFGRTTVFLEGRREDVRTESTNLGVLTAEANLFVAQKVDQSVTISIKNGGGIRSPIGEVADDGTLLPTQTNPVSGKQEGEISELDISNALRFNNDLTLLTLTAEQLIAVIEHGVEASAAGATPGQFPQVAGLKFSFDPNLPPGDRLLSLAVVDDDDNIIDIVLQNGQLVGPASRTFRIVTLGFLADGGDDYPFPEFANTNRVELTEINADVDINAANFAQFGTEQDALAEFLAANFLETPFDEAETSAENDVVIQNLSFRSDVVLDADLNTFLLTGTELDDDLTGGNSDDDLFGFVGADTIVGLNGSDRLRGSKGADDISGGGGDDVIIGGADDDDLSGDDGDDRLRGLNGDDFIVAGDGDDIVKGGQGDDVIEGGDGDDQLSGNSGNDIISGDGGDDQIRGNQGDDFIEGGDGDDILRGGNGNDTLIGGDGDDTLVGSSGDDTLEGGLGDDLIRTGPGNDIVVIGADTGTDEILGFNLSGSDLISLIDLAFDDLSISSGDARTTIEFGGATLAVFIGVSELTSADFV
ncbi:MAG: 5'-nucleotidase C-terminal domain-containing protein [Elainellaceae cyanobacterium]